MLAYLGCEEESTEGEDCGHLDDGEQQLVGFHDALRLLVDPPPPAAVLVFPFNDGHQRRGDQEHHPPKEEEVCSRRTQIIRLIGYDAYFVRFLDFLLTLSFESNPTMISAFNPA